MKNLHGVFATLEHRLVEDIGVLDPFVFHQVGKPFALHTGHIYNVGKGNHIGKFCVLVVFQIAVFDGLLYITGQFEFGWRNQMESAVEIAKCLGK